MNVSGALGFWSTQLTMMSCSARNPASGTVPFLVIDAAHPSRGVVLVEVEDACGVDRRGHGGGLAVGEDVDVVHAECVERRHRTAGGRAEADDDGTEPASVVTSRSRDLHGVEHGAVAGDLVVLVEHVQVEGTVAVPVIHRLECDERELPVDGHLRELLVLHAVRPSPEHLPDTQRGDVAEQRLGLQEDVALLDELLTGPEAGDPALQPVVGHAVAIPVSLLEVHVPPEVLGDPSQVRGDAAEVGARPAWTTAPRRRGSAASPCHLR